MKRKRVFLFPGQGVQYYQMGLPLYQNCSVFRDWLERARNIIFEYISIDIIQELYGNGRSKSERFDDLLVSQTSLVAVTSGIAKSLVSRGLYPDIVLGTSLGEISASIFADSIDLESALLSVIEHVKIFIQCSEKGAMVAIFDAERRLDIRDIQDVGFEICAENFPGATVFGGPMITLKDVERILSEKQIMYEVLPIKIAFHTYMIDNCKKKFVEQLGHNTHQEPKYPIFSSAKLDFVDHYTAEYFWSVVRDPILFSQAITKLESLFSCDYIDIGPSGSLSTFLQFILARQSQSRSHKVLTPFTNSVDLNAFVKQFKFGEELSA